MRQVGEGTFPYVVALVLTDASNPAAFRQICTGTLVSNRDVLTSEHCVAGNNPDHFQIIVGSRDLRNGVRLSTLFWLSFEEWCRHVGKRISYYINDIAMIRVNYRSLMKLY